MLNKLTRGILRGVLKFSTPEKMAGASIIGFILGLMPFREYNLFIAIILSVLFQLNVFAIILGLIITSIAMPVIFDVLREIIEIDGVRGIG